MKADNPLSLSRELILEHIRRARFPNRISRLRGIFCFLDLSSAEKAIGWASGPKSHFRPECLAELSLTSASAQRDRLDANWISRVPVDEDGNITELEWTDRYWSGAPHSDDEPIWETLIDGKAIVLGETLRERAYDKLRVNFPKSLMFLEIARLAARIDSDLGNISAFLREDSDDIALDFAMDMRDADNPQFLENLTELRESGHPINWTDITPHAAQDSFGNVPDLRPFGFRRPKIAMPYLSKSP